MSPESVHDPREMRKILHEMSYTGDSPFKGAQRGFSASGSLVRHVLRAANHQGMSGEDVYTMLAYHALIQLEEARGLLLQQSYLNPTVTFPAG